MCNLPGFKNVICSRYLSKSCFYHFILIVTTRGFVLHLKKQNEAKESKRIAENDDVGPVIFIIMLYINELCLNQAKVSDLALRLFVSTCLPTVA